VIIIYRRRQKYNFSMKDMDLFLPHTVEPEMPFMVFWQGKVKELKS